MATFETGASWNIISPIQLQSDNGKIVNLAIYDLSLSLIYQDLFTPDWCQATAWTNVESL